MSRKKLIKSRTWEQFQTLVHIQEAVLLRWVNRMLRVFGWVIVLEYDDNKSLKFIRPGRGSGDSRLSKKKRGSRS